MAHRGFTKTTIGRRKPGGGRGETKRSIPKFKAPVKRRAIPKRASRKRR